MLMRSDDSATIPTVRRRRARTAALASFVVVLAAGIALNRSLRGNHASLRAVGTTTTASPSKPTCPPLPPRTERQLTLRIVDRPKNAESRLSGRVTISNSGRRQRTVEGDAPVSLHLLEVDTGVPVSDITTLPRGLTGFRLKLPPGAHRDLPAMGTLIRCDQASRQLVSPGTYLVVATLFDERTNRWLVSNRLSMTV